ncbi:HNH endonuclease [Belnapia sp. T18]|uniref:HNH endonuclease n=1 Tax=Belnapia arida TaxID=2804533 RepID=A0ABS1UCR7_9PROT|nr:HNH endonuclease signature motif containing protein [Belnapia arida]MBL6082487.1 HNH endonuclease [Belnapia arida]
MSDRYYRSRHWLALREATLRRDPLCVICARAGLVVAATVADHIVERSRGGADDLCNTRGLCASCHGQRSHGGEAAPKGCDASGMPADPMHWWHGSTGSRAKNSWQLSGSDRAHHPKRISPPSESDFEAI